MFIYSDFKDCVVNKRFDDARAMLEDGAWDKGSFATLAEVTMFLSLIFRYPQENVWQTLKDNWSSFEDFFRDYINEVPQLYDNTEMQSDFIILFKQDFKGHKIVPYISYYTEEKKLLYGESTFKIREWMADEGFVLDKEAAELEDNIYLVLEFMSTLFNRMAGNIPAEEPMSALSVLYCMLDTYGRVISDEFAELVSKRTEKPFYAACGRLLGSFTREIDVLLEEMFSSIEK